jgi:RNA polymerase sigma factor (sigma-70 family)
MTFDDFVRAELGPLTRFAGALAGDRWLAEDILSDALLKIAPRWWRISRMADPAAYVRRTVVTTYLSDRRKAHRRRTDPAGDPEVLDRAGPDASVAAVAQDEAQRLLARLTPRQKAVVVLRYLLDESDDEIALTLGCTPGTVRSHLSHAGTTLRLATAEDEECAP